MQFLGEPVHCCSHEFILLYSVHFICRCWKVSTGKIKASAVAQCWSMPRIHPACIFSNCAQHSVSLGWRSPASKSSWQLYSKFKHPPSWPCENHNFSMSYTPWSNLSSCSLGQQRALAWITFSSQFSPSP